MYNGMKINDTINELDTYFCNILNSVYNTTGYEPLKFGVKRNLIYKRGLNSPKNPMLHIISRLNEVIPKTIVTNSFSFNDHYSISYFDNIEYYTYTSLCASLGEPEILEMQDTDATIKKHCGLKEIDILRHIVRLLDNIRYIKCTVPATYHYEKIAEYGSGVPINPEQTVVNNIQSEVQNNTLDIFGTANWVKTNNYPSYDNYEAFTRMYIYTWRKGYIDCRLRKTAIHIPNMHVVPNAKYKLYYYWDRRYLNNFSMNFNYMGDMYNNTIEITPENNSIEIPLSTYDSLVSVNTLPTINFTGFNGDDYFSGIKNDDFSFYYPVFIADLKPNLSNKI